MPELESPRDVMQVCRNGHVVTDRLRGDPQSGATHCERCGADTLFHCETCGEELAGVPPLFGVQPIGTLRPPHFCANCGAAFPWAVSRVRPAPPGKRLELETLLRRLPLVIRQLRSRHANRPPFRVEDQRDLEDLLRALLPLCCEEVRPERRTPSYSASTQTDFLLLPERVAVVAKRATAGDAERWLWQQVDEDADYYRKRDVDLLLILLSDAAGVVRDGPALESACARRLDGIQMRCVVAS